MEPTGHQNPLATLVIHLKGPVGAVILEVQGQVSGLLPVVVPQVLFQAVVHVAVAPVGVEQEVEEETKI